MRSNPDIRLCKFFLLSLGICFLGFAIAENALAQSNSFLRNVPMYPWVEQAPFNPDHPTTTGDTLSPIMRAAIQYNSQLNLGVRSAGAIIVLCWNDVEPSPNHWNFLTKTQPSSIEQLGEILDPDQSVIIGIRGGTCAPGWLKEFGVPMPDNFLNQFKQCEPMTLPASYHPKYVERYLMATQALWNALKSIRLKKDPRQTLQDRVIAIRNGAMVSSTSGEMGIFSQGCKAAQSQYDVARIWAQNGYTPQKAKTAYAQILKGIFQIVASKPNVAISQSVLGKDRYAFPLDPMQKSGDIVESLLTAA